MEVKLGDNGPILTEWVQVTIYFRGGSKTVVTAERGAAECFRDKCIIYGPDKWVSLAGVRATPLVLKTFLNVRTECVVGVDIQEAPSVLYNAAKPGSLEQVAATGLVD